MKKQGRKVQRHWGSKLQSRYINKKTCILHPRWNCLAATLSPRNYVCSLYCQIVFIITLWWGCVRCLDYVRRQISLSEWTHVVHWSHREVVWMESRQTKCRHQNPGFLLTLLSVVNAREAKQTNKKHLGLGKKLCLLVALRKINVTADFA